MALTQREIWMRVQQRALMRGDADAYNNATEALKRLDD